MVCGRYAIDVVMERISQRQIAGAMCATKRAKRINRPRGYDFYRVGRENEEANAKLLP